MAHCSSFCSTKGLLGLEYLLQSFSAMLVNLPKLGHVLLLRSLSADAFDRQTDVVRS